MKYGIVVFPGANCDHDAKYATKYNAGAESVYLWHKDTELPPNLDVIILPGGFTYGDYLRPGAIAQFSPIMQEVRKFGKRGGYILGICNGFQVLTETRLLPGTMYVNNTLNFINRDVYLNVRNNSTAFTSMLNVDDVIRLPIAHGDGNYYAEEDTLKQLEDENRIIFQYCDKNGEITQESNPNGSLKNIAGIINKEGNILGMMPHPERYCDKILGCDDGLKIFESLANLHILT